MDDGYRGSHLQGMRWCDASHTSRRWGALGNQVPELHRIGRPAFVQHKFNSRFYYCPVLWEWKRICVAWELPVKIAASLNKQNINDKRLSGVVLSLPGGGFEPRLSAT